jgi:hypothetical protein
MPKCPKCKELIDELNYCCKIYAYGQYNGNYINSEQDDHDSGDDYRFSCPECSKVLFTDVDDAEEFLDDRLIYEV